VLLADHPATRGAGPIATALFVEWLFQNVPLRKVCFDVFGFNAGVIRMLRRLGIHQDMQRPEHRYWNGRYWDQFGFAVNREELPALMQRFRRGRKNKTGGEMGSADAVATQARSSDLLTHSQRFDEALAALID
jgi:hypothetical protein